MRPLLLLLPSLLLHGADPAPTVRVIGKAVADLPAVHDARIPESTCAALLRAQAEGCSDLRPLFPAQMHGRLPKEGFKAQEEPRRSRILATRLEEVHQLQDHAGVIATAGGKVRLTFLRQEEGRWLMLGTDDFATLEQAREKVGRSLLMMSGPAKAAPVAAPDAHLAAHVAHLQRHGQPPVPFLLEAVRTHRLTAIGELHNRPRSWALWKELVRHPDLPGRVGTIYMELPCHAQGLMDAFLAAPTLDLEPVREILRSFQYSGWPCRDEVDFLAALWEVNQGLPAGKRLRVRLVDQAWDWGAVREKADLARLEVDRDELMARLIQEDMGARKDGRNALFQVGLLHLPSGLSLRNKAATPFLSAGQRLRQNLGSQLFTVVQHGPVFGNTGGRVGGRVARGLFDEALARVGSKSLAFALAGSPFAQAPFDMSLDLQGYGGTFGRAFDAYLTLGPLEEETASEVAPDFYTGAFAREVDRRCRLMFGAGVRDVEGLSGSDGAAIAAGQARWMGRPMFWVSKLGPMDAWRK